MHWLGYNDVVSWLNEAIFQPTINFENFKINLYFICLPACLPAIMLGVGLQKFHMIKVMMADLQLAVMGDISLL